MKHIGLITLLALFGVGCASTGERIARSFELATEQDRPRAAQVTITKKGASLGYGPAEMVIGSQTEIWSFGSGANKNAPAQTITFRNADSVSGSVVPPGEQSAAGASTDATLSIDVKPTDSTTKGETTVERAESP